MARQRFPLHQFHWPQEIVGAIREHVEHASSRLNPSRYEQEPAYVAALIARLDGLVYDGPEGRVELIGTIVNDRGPNSAERKWGADFAITASLSQGKRTASKAVLGQAKRGSLSKLRSSERSRLDDQCHQMLGITDACLVMETPAFNGLPEYEHPSIQIIGEDQTSGMSLADYIVNHLIVCSHGDRRPDFVVKALSSRLTGLHVEIDA